VWEVRGNSVPPKFQSKADRREKDFLREKKSDQENLSKKVFCHIKGGKKLSQIYTNLISLIMSEEVYNGAIG
jgi:dephospho-CoA kinase